MIIIIYIYLYIIYDDDIGIRVWVTFVLLLIRLNCSSNVILYFECINSRVWYLNHVIYYINIYIY